jgi:prepilin-type N-terminal cleavage/methylation domain-containing protein
MKNALIKKLASKSKKNKGFTLIEVIVVLVILAILAAIAIPALTGYIDKAGERAAISEAHSVQVGLQAHAVDEYADGHDISTLKDADWITGVEELTGTTYTISDVSFTKNTLTGFKLVTTNGNYTVTYDTSKSPAYETAAN